MGQRYRHQGSFLRRVFQQQWMFLLLGIVLTLAVLGVWQELLQEELQAGVQSSLPNVVLFGGVIGAWVLTFTVYLGQRSERYVQQVRKVNQQLQQEILERQRIENELCSRETSIRNLTARLELAVQSAGIGIWDWDIVNNSLVWDDQMYRLYGLNSRNSVEVYEAWESAIHPDDLEMAIATSLQAIRGEKDYEPEFRIVHPDGTVRYIQAYAVILRDIQGQAQRMIGANFDITDRRQSELVLKESEAKYRQLVNHMNVGFVVHTPDTRIVQCNETACRLLGLSMEQVLGKESIDPAWHFLREDGTAMPVEEYPVNRVLSTRVPLENYVLGIHRGTQSQTWGLVTAFPEFDPNNQLKQIVVTFIDISRLKRAETELREMTEVMEYAISGISKLDTQGHYLYVNKAYADMTGYLPEEMIGMGWQSTVHPDDLEQVSNAYQQMVQNGKVEVEARGIRKGGSIFYKQLVMVSTYDKHQQFVGHYCFLKDISDRKQAEVDSQNSQARFAGIVEIANDAIITIDAEQKITLFNKGAERIFGYTAEEIVGHPLAILIPDRFAESHHSHINGYAWSKDNARPMAQRRPIFGRRKNGTEFPAEASISKLNLNGEIIFTTFLRDISERIQHETERQRAEEVLRQSEEKFRMAIDFTYNWEYWQAPDGSFVYVSPACERITGYTPAEFIENPHLIQAIVYPDDAFIFAHHVCDGELETGSVEFRIITRSNEIRWIAHVCQPVFNHAGEYLGRRASNRDISERIQLEAERQQSEEALRESEARFQAFMRYSPAPAWISNSEGKIAYLSQAYIDTFRIPDRDVLGQSIFDLFSADVAQPLLENIQTVARTQQVLEAIEVAPRRDGTMGTFLVYKFPMPNSFGQLLVGGVAIDITQQHQAEAALRQSEATKQAIIQAIPDLLIRMHFNGDYVEFISNSDFNIVSPAQVRQDVNIYDVLPSNLAQLRMHHAQLALESNTTQIYEHQIVIEGQPRYEEVRIVPLLQDEVLVMVRDITDRKQSAIALQLSQEQLQLALEASGDGLWDWNIATGEVYYSSQYMTMLGYDIDELPQNFETWKYLTHSDDQPWVLNRLNAHFKDSSQQYSFDYRVRTKSGEWKWVADYGKVVARDERGNPLRMIGTHRDINDRKQAETELKHQKDMLQTIVNHIPVMIALFNTEGRIEFVNPAFERVLGWSLADWQQQDVLLECYPDPTYYKTVIEHMLAANGSWKDFTTLTKTKQAIETSWTNVSLSNGSNLGIGQDISDRKQKEAVLQQAMEAAEAANLAKSMFLANMSHELRTPLNVILGFAQVMSHDSSLTPSQQEDLQTIHRSGDHLLSLINDVLDLSKIEVGHSTLEESGFDLIALLHTLRTMMTERANDKQIQLTFEIAPEVPQFVIADAQKLRQILLNLLSNAIKFTKQGGVTLRVTSHEAQTKICSAFSSSQNESDPKSFNSSPSYRLQFEVIDTGVGIAAEDIETIFDAFSQAEAGRRSLTGTGLGLTISRKLVELMDGQISVHSMPNLGSTFTITIPVCPTSGIDTQPKQNDRIVIGLVPGQPHRRILVVDDQPDNRLLMVRLLSQIGLEVREATDGQEAIQIWQAWQPDLTWMDIRMPEVNGYEATKQIRAMEQEPASIIIALTAQASQSDRALAFAAGCNDYISKPFRRETVLLKLAEYLGLEYLYEEPLLSAETEPSSSHPSPPQPAGLSALALSDLSDFTGLSQTWLRDLEKATIRCDDQAVMKLVNQLPPEFSQLIAYLTKLAYQYDFEQILKLLRPNSSI